MFVAKPFVTWLREVISIILYSWLVDIIRDRNKNSKGLEEYKVSLYMSSDFPVNIYTSFRLAHRSFPLRLQS